MCEESLRNSCAPLVLANLPSNVLQALMSRFVESGNFNMWAQVACISPPTLHAWGGAVLMQARR